MRDINNYELLGSKNISESEIENEYKNGYITFEEMEVAKEKVKNGMTAKIIIHPESRTYNRYRIMINSTWSGWRKTCRTEKELSEMVAHPKISRVEWKNI